MQRISQYIDTYKTALKGQYPGQSEPMTMFTMMANVVEHETDEGGKAVTVFKLKFCT